MRRRDVSWIRQQTVHVFAMGLVIVTLRSMWLASQSNSWVGYCSSPRPRKLGPIGERWIWFQIPFQCCSLLGLLPCTLSPLGALLLCLLSPSFSSGISPGPHLALLSLYTHSWDNLLPRLVVHGSQVTDSSPAHSSHRTAWIRAGALQLNCLSSKTQSIDFLPV